MSNHKSAAKRARQTVRRTKVNNQRTSTVKSFEKSLLKAISEKNVKALPELLSNYTSQIAKAAKNGIFKKETMSRKIGRLSARVQALIK